LGGIMASEYYVSKTEISRRKRAYISLISSIAIGVTLGTANLIAGNPLFFSAGITILSGLLALSAVFPFKILNKYLKTKVYIKGVYLIREAGKESEKFEIENIKSIHIKWTTRKTIREIKFSLEGDRTLFLNGLDNFEQFRAELLKKAAKNTVKEYYEPMDFDHPFFYVFLGLFLGFTATWAARIMLFIGPKAVNVISVLTMLFITVLGIYFILNKPMYGRFRGKTRVADYISGAFFIIAGIYIFLFQILKF
jgi:hypothetical protein